MPNRTNSMRQSKQLRTLDALHEEFEAVVTDLGSNGQEMAEARRALNEGLAKVDPQVAKDWKNKFRK